MSVQLRDYQVNIANKGVEIINKYNLLYLSLEVRTGKTLTSLTIADKLNSRSVIFFTKKKAVKSIQEDYRILAPSFELTVTNYEQIKKFNPNDYDLVIVDEAQNFGAFPKPSQRTINLRKFCLNKKIMLLSGTPSPESYSQLFHQLQLSTYSPFNQYRTFYIWARAGFVNIKQKRIGTGQLINDYKEAHGDLIWKHIKHLFITFTQEQAGFSAPVEEHFLTVEMSDECKAIYKRLERENIYTRITPSGSEIIATANGGADLINKLAQVSSGTLIFDDDTKGSIIDHNKALFIQREFQNRKIAIFYKYKAELDLLKTFFPNYTESPEEFNSIDGYTFLGQVQSAREGVNLSKADALVMFNIDFSATSYFQARARIQSKDRKGSAPLYWIFSDHGIERRIYKAVSNKINFTYSYYRKTNARKTNTGESQKGVGAARMDSVTSH